MLDLMKSLEKAASDSGIRVDWLLGDMHGMPMQHSLKNLGHLDGVFHDREAWQSMDPQTIVYSVQWQEPVLPNTEGGLFWGSTTIEAGRVGDEYFMTRGHFHTKRDRGEYYCTVQGKGMLILMGEDRLSRVEIMSPGSLHYISGHTAHRAVNTGDAPLVFWACWPSDAGHDYDTVAKEHFSVRVLERDGIPEFVPEEPRRF